MRFWNDTECTIPNAEWIEEYYDDSCLPYGYWVWDDEARTTVYKEIMYWSTVECNAYVETSDTTTTTASSTPGGNNEDNGNVIIAVNAILATCFCVILML